MPADSTTKSTTQDTTASDTPKTEAKAEDPTVITVKAGGQPASNKVTSPANDIPTPATDELKKVEPVPEVKIEDSPPENDNTTSSADQPKKVSSFSLLDSEEDKDNEKAPKPVKVDIEVKKDKDEVTQEEIKDWIDLTSDKKGDVEKKFSIKKFLLILFIVIILGVIAGGVYYYTTKVEKNGEPSQTEEQVVEPTQEPTPTDAQEEVNLSEYEVNILNGSGIPGEAGVVENLLIDAGFEDIDTGNAPSYDYEDTEVSMKEDTPGAVYDAIEEAISETYTPALSETYLEDSSDYDIIVTVGVKK